MRKVNTTKMAELTWSSPKGKFIGAGKEISEALGRKPESTDLNERHPFDVEILRIPPGKAPYSYHSHSAQWEFYHVISGSGVVRHKDGTTPIEAGDAFICQPGEPHQITNDTTQDMILYVVADNPIFFFSSRRRHTRSLCDWSSDCALPIWRWRRRTNRGRGTGRRPMPWRRRWRLPERPDWSKQRPRRARAGRPPWRLFRSW